MIIKFGFFNDPINFNKFVIGSLAMHQTNTERIHKNGSSRSKF